MTPDASSSSRSPDEGSLADARTQREQLAEAAELVEDRVARPGNDPGWIGSVADALVELSTAFASHVDEVERADGLLAQVVADAPRLSPCVSQLEDEHREIDLRISEAIDLVRSGDPAAVDDIRAGTGDVLAMISRHRQTGADLVYEAYLVDIGGG